MPVFEIEHQGKVYEVDAPDENTALSALPGAEPPPSAAPVGDQSAAIGRGLINGIPVVGPSILSGVNSAVAGVRSLQNGTPYAQERENVENFSQGTATANPGSTMAGEIGGAVVGTAPLMAAAPAAFGAGTAPLLARSGASALTGAGLGGADAAARSGGDLDQTKTGAIIGLLSGGVAPGIAAGAGRVAGSIASRLNPPEAIPTISQLDAGADAAYAAARGTGAQIAQPSFRSAVDDITDTLARQGLDPDMHPRVSAIARRFDRSAGAAPTIDEVETLRRLARDSAKTPDEGRLGSMMVHQLDDYTGNLQPKDVIAGDAETAVRSLKEGRDLYARARRAETVETAVREADLRAASTYAGGNADNATRQNIRKILTDPNEVAGFSQAERDAMEAIVRGSKVQDVARLVGRMSPTTGGLMASLGLGATVANPLMAAAPVAGMAAKAFSDRATATRVRNLSELIRSGGEIPVSPWADPAREGTEEIVRLLASQAPPAATRRRVGR